MGLFDDVFGSTKPSNQQAATQATLVATPTVDPMLVMNEQTTSTPPAVDAFLNMSAATADMPSYTDRKAAGEAVSTSISSTEGVSLFADATTAPTQSETVTPVVEAVFQPEITTPTMDLFSQTETSSPIVENISQPEVSAITEETPVLDFSSIDVVASNESTADNQVVEQVDTPVVEVVSEELFVGSETVNEVPQNPVIDTVVDVATENSADNGLDLFAMPSNNEEIVQGETKEQLEPTSSDNIFAFDEEKIEEVKVAEEKQDEAASVIGLESEEDDLLLDTLSSDSSSESKQEEVMASTADFIMASLLQLDSMEKNLSDKKQAFLDKAEEYRLKKEEFAKLEEQAILDSKTMDEEQSRITTMRNYFQKQQKQEAELTESVNTALAGIATQKAVGNAMKNTKTRTSKKAVTA